MLVCCLLGLLALLPPETRGESMAGASALIALLVLLHWRAGSRQSAGQLLLVVALVVLIPLARSSVSPSAAVEPVSIALLAAGAGIAALSPNNRLQLLRFGGVTLATVGAIASLHAVHQRLWGLERVAREIRGDPTVPDAAALLARLEGGRGFAAFSTPAALGGYLALVLPATVGLALAGRGRWRATWLVLAGLQAVGLLAAASATAAGALAGAILLALLLRGRDRRRLVVGLGIAALLLAGIAIQRGGVTVRPSDPSGPWRLRAGNFRAAVEMANDHAWKGAGPGAFSELYPVYRRPGDNETRHVHDLPLELAAELGWPLAVPTATLFFVLFVGPLWRRSGEPAPVARGVSVGLAAFALQNLGDYTAFMPSLLWSAALLRGLVAQGAEPAEEEGSRPGGLTRVAAGWSLVAVIGSAALCALAGLSDNARIEARYAAFGGDHAEATRQAERATRLAPWDVDAAILLARLDGRATEEEDAGAETVLRALERAERAVMLSPVRAAAREARARARLRAGDVPGAYADLVAAVRLNPLHPDYATSRDTVRSLIEPAENRP